MPQRTKQPRGVAVAENPPQLIRQVQRRMPLPAEAPFPPSATLELARVWVDDSSKVTSRRVRSANAPGAVSVTVRAGGTLGRPPDMATETVPRAALRRLDASVREGADGHRPLHLAVHFKPAGLRRGRSLEPREGKRRGGAIFPPDDRYIYEDTAFPWCTVGLVETEDGWGSGTMIGRRLMLTA
jgi:hypothetical protein